MRSAFRREAGQHLLEAGAQDLRDAPVVDYELHYERSLAHSEAGLRDRREHGFLSHLPDQGVSLEADDDREIGSLHLPRDEFVYAHISLEHRPWDAHGGGRLARRLRW